MSEQFVVGLKITGDATGAKAAAAEAAAAVKGLTAAEREAAAAALVQAQNTKQLQAAVQQMTATETLAAAAVKAEAAAQAEAAAVAMVARERFAALPPVVADVDRGMARGGGTARMFGQQLSQVVQQGAVTGNYLGALAVQLPDMALGFGGVAIAASLVATVVLPMLISAFGGGKTAVERATDANSVYGDSLGVLQGDIQSSIDLQDRYAAAVRSGSATTVAALRSEAAIRSALLAMDQNDLEKAQKEAAARTLDALQVQADLQSKQTAILNKMADARAQKATDPTGAQNILEEQQIVLDAVTAKLNDQRDATKRIGLEFDLNKAKIEGNAAAIVAAKQALDNMAAGVPPISSALGAATGAAAGFNSQLSVAMGYAASIQASINGINFGNIAQAAELAALHAGLSPDAARNVGTVQQTAAQLKPLLDRGGVLGDYAQGQVDQTSAGLNTKTSTAAAIAQWLKDHPTSTGGGAGGGGGTAPQTDAITKFLDSQQRELDLLRETDPVQKEMIRNRDLLAHATDAQRAAMEESIRSGIAEKAQIEATSAAWSALGQTGEQALEDIFLNGKKATDVILGMEKALAAALLKATLLGEGPLAGLLGTAQGGGLVGGLQKSNGGGLLGVLLGVGGGGGPPGAPAPALAKASGGMISGPGSGTSDSIPILASDGEFMVNARATATHRPLLEAINAGQVPRFAGGGLISHAPRGFADGGAVTTAPDGDASWARSPAAAPGRGGDVHNHFYITTPNPRAFAEDRVSVARGAARLVSQAGRYA